MRRFGIALALAALISLTTAGIAAADHENFLVTPGTTVEDIARSQTAKCGDEPGGHKFHVNVHTGTPGTYAFGQAGKVSVDKVAAPTC